MPISFKIDEDVMAMEYAVRGPIPHKALQMKRQGRDVIFCNIGNPHALGQKPLTYYRQVLSLLEDPFRIVRERSIMSKLDAADRMPYQILDLCDELLGKMETGLGAYTESKGLLFIREAVAAYIDRRDSVANPDFVPADPDRVFVTNGASEGAKYVIEMLLADRQDGIMIPIPQYPLYSAAIRKHGGVQVNYYPDEDAGWTLSREMLESAYGSAQADGVCVKCIVAINPGNPTGAVLDRQSIVDVIGFAEAHGLAIIADEVYQENTYGAEFLSFARMLGKRDVPLFSLHSVSKGFHGECGHRGGYLEVRNAPRIEGCDSSFIDVLLKQVSVSLCSNTAGQVLTYLLVSPPEEESEIYDQFILEKTTILDDLHAKAAMIKEAFKKMDGVECFGEIGAMYLFPRLNKLPEGSTDFDYCMALLEETGLCTVNGSGFGQSEGTQHLRIAFLPPREMLEDVLPRWIAFHNDYVCA